ETSAPAVSRGGRQRSSRYWRGRAARARAPARARQGPHAPAAAGGGAKSYDLPASFGERSPPGRRCGGGEGGGGGGRAPVAQRPQHLPIARDDRVAADLEGRRRHLIGDREGLIGDGEPAHLLDRRELAVDTVDRLAEEAAELGIAGQFGQGLGLAAALGPFG